MTNIRQVANVEKDGQNLTLVSVVVFSENLENGHRLSREVKPDTTFTNVSNLYSAIRDSVNELLTSGL